MYPANPHQTASIISRQKGSNWRNMNILRCGRKEYAPFLHAITIEHSETSKRKAFVDRIYMCKQYGWLDLVQWIHDLAEKNEFKKLENRACAIFNIRSIKMVICCSCIFNSIIKNLIMRTYILYIYGSSYNQWCCICPAFCWRAKRSKIRSLSIEKSTSVKS